MANISRAIVARACGNARISRALVVLLCLAGLLLAGAAIAIHFLSRDEPPPDVADLKVVRPELPADQNAFTYFERAADVLYWPKDREWQEHRLIDILYGAADWDEKLVSEFLKANERMFENFEKGLSLGACVAPEVKDIGQKTDYLSNWEDVALLVRLGALHDRKEGHEGQAFERAADLLKFGRMVEDSGGIQLHSQAARDVESVGLSTIRRLLAETALPADQLRPFIGRVMACETNREALANAYRGEYQLFSHVVDDVAAGNGPRYELPRFGVVALTFSYKPNQTRRIYAEYLRWGIENATKPSSEWQAAPEYVQWLLARGTGGPPAMKRNMVGEILLASWAPALDNTNTIACEANWTIKATAVLIALRCYESKSGDLPGTLEALVPEYLNQVPSDPFDGKPLRYSKEKRLIYASDDKFRGGSGSFKITMRESEKEGAAGKPPIEKEKP